MNVKIRTILSCLNQQQQKQKKTPFDFYKLKFMQGVSMETKGPLPWSEGQSTERYN